MSLCIFKSLQCCLSGVSVASCFKQVPLDSQRPVCSFPHREGGQDAPSTLLLSLVPVGRQEADVLLSVNIRLFHSIARKAFLRPTWGAWCVAKLTQEVFPGFPMSHLLPWKKSSHVFRKGQYPACLLHTEAQSFGAHMDAAT